MLGCYRHPIYTISLSAYLMVLVVLTNGSKSRMVESTTQGTKSESRRLIAFMYLKERTEWGTRAKFMMVWKKLWT
jgi:hypothetical protein